MNSYLIIAIITVALVWISISIDQLYIGLIIAVGALALVIGLMITEDKKRIPN